MTLPSPPEQGSNSNPAPSGAVIIGAGPAGLTAALELAKAGVPCTVLESAFVPGGLAKTDEYKGYRFDIGGHRFFTKVRVVEQIWHQLMGADFLERRRLSRIYYRGKYFKYPLEPLDALLGLGLWNAAACGFSYLYARLFPVRPELTFDAWVSNRFGRRLFKIFFESYTEKVWGIPCTEISAEWAAQRIRGLDAISLIKNMLLGKPKEKSKVVKTLIDSFHYPRLGPGMMWEKCVEHIEALQSRVCYRSRVDKIYWEPGRVLAVEAADRRYSASHFISTMPIRELIRALDPAPPPEVLAAASDFRYRDFVTVALILRQRDLFPDNWIYIHEPSVKVGRIQNFKNWSPEMVPDPETTCLGLEYFCFEGDDLWTKSDEAMRALATEELAQLKIAHPHQVIDGTVVREHKAYPIYDENHQRGLKVLRDFLPNLPNLQLVGRNGMHHYNNQDHSMLTGLLAARNILGAHYDLWKVNVDAEYHEAGEILTEEELRQLEASQPLVPERVPR
ncbi:MAG TPA: NAD(P)/FAD-dependent oxidoreductase [Bryobacteraceae bacterium]|nr:NAD(P)/FAD-dependent oxidoreductase [Bryobacteraceae bacterium]